jgi:ferredoxin--NADP+ reductase
MAQLAGVDLVVDPAELELDPASAAELAEDREAQKNLEILRELAAKGPGGAPRRIHLRFKVSPVELVGEGGKVAAIRLERNRLVPGKWGVAAEGTGELETLPVGLVVRAVGYRSEPLPDVPFDARKAIVPNDKGRVLDPATGRPLAGLYVTGWIKRGPTGLIGSNKPDGAETAAAMLEDLATTPPAPEWQPEAVDRLLAVKGVRRVDFDDWRRLDKLEIERGRAQGRPRVKLARVEEMLAALDGVAIGA